MSNIPVKVNVSIPYSICAGGNNVPDNSITTNKIKNGAVTTPKIADNAVTPEKLNQKYATEKFVEEKISEAEFGEGGGTIPDNSITTEKLADSSVTPEKLDRTYLTEHQSLENYATKDYVGEAIQDITEISWKYVKIWSKDDGLTTESLDPLEFDFSQIPKTEHAKFKFTPKVIDLDAFEGRTIVSVLFCHDENKNITIIAMAATNIMEYDRLISLNIYSVDNYSDMIYLRYFESGDTLPNGNVADVDGWYDGSNKFVEGANDYLDLDSLKIVNYASLYPKEYLPENAETSPQIVLDLFLGDMLKIYGKCATEAFVNGIVGDINSILDNINGEVV